MKKVLFAWISLTLFNGIHAQNEFVDIGATLLTLNPYASRYYENEKPLVEYPNGVFIRYNKNRFSLRTLAGYSQYKFETTDLSYNTRTTLTETKDLRFGFGAQYSFHRKAKWLYVFSDLLYRHISSVGISVVGYPTASSKYTIQSNGLDSYLGLGSSIKIYEHFFLIQEIGFNGRFERVTYSIPGIFAFSSNYWNSNVKPMFRISLVYKLPKYLF